jgi:hypothetical protein
MSRQHALFVPKIIIAIFRARRTNTLLVASEGVLESFVAGLPNVMVKIGDLGSEEGLGAVEEGDPHLSLARMSIGQ